MIVDDLMALADRYAEENSPPLEEYLQRRDELRAALESALRASEQAGYERGRSEPEQAAEPVAWRYSVQPQVLGPSFWAYDDENTTGDAQPLYSSPPRREPLAGCSDLRDAKWLDPECCEAGACQSLRFKNKREPLTEERCVALAREFSGNPVPAIASPELWFLRGIRAAERAHGIGETP